MVICNWTRKHYYTSHPSYTLSGVLFCFKQMMVVLPQSRTSGIRGPMVRSMSMGSTLDPTLEVENNIQRYRVFGEAFLHISIALILFRSLRDCHRLSSLKVKGCKFVDCFKVRRDGLVTDAYREKFCWVRFQI